MNSNVRIFRIFWWDYHKNGNCWLSPASQPTYLNVVFFSIFLILFTGKYCYSHSHSHIYDDQINVTENTFKYIYSRYFHIQCHLIKNSTPHRINFSILSSNLVKKIQFERKTKATVNYVPVKQFRTEIFRMLNDIKIYRRYRYILCIIKQMCNADNVRLMSAIAKQNFISILFFKLWPNSIQILAR